jgi:hypothetical protein
LGRQLVRWWEGWRVRRWRVLAAAAQVALQRVLQKGLLVAWSRVLLLQVPQRVVQQVAVWSRV